MKGTVMLTAENIAKVCHEANRAYSQAHGDQSHQPWDESPEWQRQSAVNGVRFHLNNPDATPQRSHELWLEQKRNEGWTYGPVKNPELKQHPCFIPYDGLPAAQQIKDSLFKAIVDALRPIAAPPAMPAVPS